MAFQVEQLLNGKRQPEIATPGEHARIAITRMRQWDFSQLPVVEGSKAVGVVSHESVLSAMLRFRCDIDKLAVRDAIERATVVAPDDGLAELLEALSRASAVLVVDGDKNLKGIVTDYDTTAWFREDVEDRMNVADIEVGVRTLALKPFGGSAEASDLKNVIRGLGTQDDRARFHKALASLAVPLDRAKANAAFEEHFFHDRQFDKLSFGDFIHLLDDEERWDVHLADVFGPKRRQVVALLHRVREARNSLAHLRELNPEMRDEIRFCAEWLARVMASVQPTANRAPATAHVEALGAVDPAKDATVIEDEVGASEGSYAPLSLFLQGLSPGIDHIAMQFADVEKILGRALPASARRHAAWWANDSKSHVQAKAWLDVGWRVTARMNNELIELERIQERARDYLSFFTRLVARLKARGIVPVTDAQSSGRNWHYLAPLATAKGTCGFFAASFARGGRFRVEAYLTTQDPARTKAVFDHLSEQRTVIEAAAGTPLSWERLDTKQASRIARYWALSITSSQAELDEGLNVAVSAGELLYVAISSKLRSTEI